MKLSTAINNEMKKLKRKVEKKGIYENFGQNEVQKLKDKFIDISDYTDEMNQARQQIQSFNEWCMHYNG